MNERNLTRLNSASVVFVLVLVIAAGAVAPIAAAAGGSSGSSGSDNPAAQRIASPIQQVNETATNATNETTTENETTANAPNETVAGNDTVAPVYTPDWKTSGQLNNSTMENMTKEQLIARIQSLQRVFNQTQEQYLSRIRNLQLLLNRSGEANVTAGNVTVTGNLPNATNEMNTTNETDVVRKNATEVTNVTTIKLGARISGWQGMSPEPINGTVNPTLNLTAGENYTVTWVNLDGAPHNFVLLNSRGGVVLRTQIMSDEGATQSVTFTVTEAMDTYLCEVHPSSMVGNVTALPENSTSAASMSGNTANG
jgi:plastocyanin